MYFFGKLKEPHAKVLEPQFGHPCFIRIELIRGQLTIFNVTEIQT